MGENISDIEILSLSYEKPGAFGEIFDRYQSQFLAVAKSRLSSKNAAEDAVQNTFIRIYKYGRKFLSEGGDFKNWSYSILTNCVKDEVAKRSPTIEMSDEIESVLAAESEYPEYESTEFLQSVFRRIDSTSAEILKMRYLLGKSFKHIGKMLGLSSGAARVRAYRAKKYFIEAHKQVS